MLGLPFVIERLTALLGPIANLSKEKRDLKDNALRSVLIALMETKEYYQKISRGSARNVDTEAQLAKYWAAAAIPLRHIDKDLAMTCELKAEYWINPDNWDDVKNQNLDISLESVTSEYRKLANLKIPLPR